MQTLERVRRILATDRQNRGVKQTYDDQTEIYMVHDHIWEAAGMEAFGGSLCIGCLEQRLGWTLEPKDFTDDVFNRMPCTDRLRTRRGCMPD